ncbi:MAG: UPF0175 family protein [Spirochaetales bacterium]|nr:UPF0175 family protein [Spirochaetales bacterium]
MPFFRIFLFSSPFCNDINRKYKKINNQSHDTHGQEYPCPYTALFLFQEQKLSIGKAARLSGLSIYDFMMEAGKHNVPVINYDVKDLKQELETLK